MYASRYGGWLFHKIDYLIMLEVAFVSSKQNPRKREKDILWGMAILKTSFLGTTNKLHTFFKHIISMQCYFFNIKLKLNFCPLLGPKTPLTIYHLFKLMDNKNESLGFNTVIHQRQV